MEKATASLGETSTLGTTLKDQYVAAVSREMKVPLEMIVDLTHEIAKRTNDNVSEIQNAAKYLLSLVDELTEFNSPKL